MNILNKIKLKKKDKINNFFSLKFKKSFDCLFSDGCYYKSKKIGLRFSKGNDNKYYIGYSIPKSKFPKAFERNLIKRRFRAQVNICSELKKSHPGNFLFIYLDNEVPSSKNLSIEITDVVKKLNQNT